MNSDLYLRCVLLKKKISLQEKLKTFTLVKQQLYPVITRWANKYLLGIIPSGSYAKGTGVKGITDIDLFISLKNLSTCSLKEIYNSLYDYFYAFYNGSLPMKKQNISIRINYKGLIIDMVPARRMPDVTYPHSVYVSKKDTWTKTNINKQISYVKNSRRINEIIIMKIWRELNKLDFPSFYLELTVIEALKGRKIISLEKNIMTIFEYLIGRFRNERIVDPANSQNIISDDLTDPEKQRITEATLISYTEPYWNNIIW